MALKVAPHERFHGVYWVTVEDGSRKLATLNLVPGKAVYGERLIPWNGKGECRLWDPYRSKLSAAVFKGLRSMPVIHGVKVLYLGASTGTTSSHVSDVVGSRGKVFCVEFAPRVMRELISNVCAFRGNMFPILADARFPERYQTVVDTVDHIYCDIAQPEQARVLADNADLFLKKGGEALLAVKARSIDVTKRPSEVYRGEDRVLRTRGFQVEERLHLEPYDQDHAMILAKYVK